jgi:hypothetical protein
MINYKGIYFGDDQGQKYTDPETGAHFEYKDMCKRLQKVMQKREAVDTVASDTKSQLQKEKEEFLKQMGLAKPAPQPKAAVQAAPEQQ